MTLVERSTHWLTVFKPKSNSPIGHGMKHDEQSVAPARRSLAGEEKGTSLILAGNDSCHDATTLGSHERRMIISDVPFFRPFSVPPNRVMRPEHSRTSAMFELDEIRSLVELQEKSYRLLKWVSSALENNTVSFNHVHECMSAADAANEWIRRYWSNIPADTKPNENEIHAFSKLFSSYLTTSFELQENPKKILTSHCGCYCSWCAYLAAGPHLKTKKISKNARKNAVQLKTIYLQQLAASAGRNLGPEQSLALTDDSDCSYNVSLATYASELLRRTKFASQGEGVLVLWREIAWTDNHPRKNFRLKPEQIIGAEQQLMERIKAA